MKEVKAWACEFCGKITVLSKEGAEQHEEMCRWKKIEHDVWVDNGNVCHAPKVPSELFGDHEFGDLDHTSNCVHGCGCWMGLTRSGGPVNPFGQCPNNPRVRHSVTPEKGQG